MDPKSDEVYDFRQVRERFANWLKDELAARNLTANAFAKKSGISKTQVYRYLDGQGIPMLVIDKIARTLEIPDEEVYRITGQVKWTIDDIAWDLHNDPKYSKYSFEKLTLALHKAGEAFYTELHSLSK
jgi:transcriptional regulator with XRE-family HTH domain